MLFTSILTGSLGPRGEFWTLLRCGPDVSAGALEDKPGSAPLSMRMELWNAGLSSGPACVLGMGRNRVKGESGQRGPFWLAGSAPGLVARLHLGREPELTFLVVPRVPSCSCVSTPVFI